MSDVTVIGLGEMGGALARAFLAGGKTTTVWNRTAAKAVSLEALGATRAATIAEAAAASPVIVICLSDYAATSNVLNGTADGLHGRLVVQLSSGTPRQARSLASRVAAQGAEFLDGAIGAWPRQIGGPDAGILIVGSETAFARGEPLLKLLAGGINYMGADIGHAKAWFNAGLAYFAAHWIGFSQGAAICQAEGLDARMFGEMMAGMSPLFGEDLRRMGDIVADGRFGNPESTLKTVSSDIGRLLELSDDLKIGTAFPILLQTCSGGPSMRASAPRNLRR